MLSIVQVDLRILSQLSGHQNVSAHGKLKKYDKLFKVNHFVWSALIQLILNLNLNINHTNIGSFKKNKRIKDILVF